jgi:hypothetical protein
MVEAHLAPLLWSGRPMGVFNPVGAASSGDDLDVLHAVEHGPFSNGCSGAPKLVGANHLWHVVMDQEPFKKGVRRLAPSLQEKVQHCAGVIDGSPPPELFALDLDADLVQKPPGTPPLFPVPQLFAQEGCERDVPLTQRPMAHLDSALLEQFLDVALAQREVRVESESGLDDAERKTVAIGCAVSHGRSAYRA